MNKGQFKESKRRGREREREKGGGGETPYSSLPPSHSQTVRECERARDLPTGGLRSEGSKLRSRLEVTREAMIEPTTSSHRFTAGPQQRLFEMALKGASGARRNPVKAGGGQWPWPPPKNIRVGGTLEMSARTWRGGQNEFSDRHSSRRLL